MVREFHPCDLDRLMELWLNGNLQAHPFIDPAYWQENEAMVRELLPKSHLLVWADEEGIWGFLGLDGGYIAGIFVDREHRSQGIGCDLLDRAKELTPHLSLNVYAENRGAVRFYERNGFAVTGTGIDPDTSQQDYTMEWTAEQ